MNHVLQLTSLALVALVALAGGGLTGCSAVRPASWPEGVENEIFEISEIEGAELTAKTGAAVDSGKLDRALSLSVLSRGLHEDVSLVSVVDVSRRDGKEAEAKLKALFRELAIFGSGSSEVNLRLGVGARYVTAYKTVRAEDRAQLPLVEQSLSIPRGDLLWVPLFQFPISAHGVVERVKNDLGEATRTLTLTETELEKATHIRLSTLLHKREPISVPASALEDARQVFAAREIDGALMARSELRKRLGLIVESDEPVFQLRLADTGLALYGLSTVDALPEDLLRTLEQSRKDRTTAAEVQRCDDSVLQSALAKASLKGLTAETCVLVLRFHTNAVEFVRAERSPEDARGSLSSSVSFVPLKAGEGPRALVRIAKAPALRAVTGASLDPRQALRVSAVRGREFLMRRTLQDSPNAFDYAFAGLSGRLEIVEFLFEESQVRVVRADPLLRLPGNSAVDRETLMLLPARYVRPVLRDELGNKLVSPRLDAARPQDADAVAIVDWTQNSIPNTNSPLEYYQLELCFAGRSERLVSDVDNRLERDGLLSFTLQSTYAGNVGAFDCAGIEAAGYFDNIQKTFTFRERVSFRLYLSDKSGADEAPLLSIPFEAQKQLGFGLFTYKKAVPNAFGQTGREGTEIPLAAVFDLSRGQKIQYVLAGLPRGTNASTKALREVIIQATREVVADLNRGLRAALKGTARERTDDIVELVVPAEADSAREDSLEGRLGDLDRNHIYFVEKATSSGVLGLGGAHHNPRTGRVESASVYLYGGNMLGLVDTLRRLARAEKDFDEAMKPRALGPVKSATGEMLLVGTDSGAAPRAGIERLAWGARRFVTRAGLARVQGGRSSLEGRALEGIERSLGLGAGSKKAAARTLGELTQNELLLRPELASAAYRRGLLGLNYHGHHGAAGVGDPAKPQLLERLAAAHVCVHRKGDLGLLAASLGSRVGEIEKLSDLELFARVWKSTLLHELGHNFGLRHNFEGSWDKANWAAPGEKSTRNYSSIMDYLSDDHFTYDGFGPQDVAALRAAYASSVELADGRLVTLADYKKGLGLGTWTDLTKERMRRLPIKKFRFCTDEDAGQRPGCDRFDLGTTPVELVRNAARGYRATYALANLPGDRLHFTTAGDGSYIGRIFSIFVPIRLVLDETLYQAFGLGEDQDLGPWIQGTVEALQFFHDVVRTPDLPAGLSPSQRFVSIETEIDERDSAGRPTGRKLRAQVPVERKALQSRPAGADLTRLAVRGIEYDKTIALILLTSRGLGVPRYEEASVRLSFADFEKLAIPDVESVLELPTLGLLHELLSVGLVPRANTSQGRLELPLSFASDISEIMQLYALIGAAVNLESQGLTAADNLASHFRVLSQRESVPAGLPSMTTPGAAHDLKYFAPVEAVSGHALVSLGSSLALLRAVGPQTSEPLQRSAAIILGIGDGDASESNAAVDALLAGLASAAGPKSGAELSALTAQIIVRIARLASSGASAESLSAEAALYRGLLRSAPSTQLAFDAADALLSELLPEDQQAIKDQVMPGSGIALREAQLLKNVQTLSSILFQLRPELWR